MTETPVGDPSFWSLALTGGGMLVAWAAGLWTSGSKTGKRAGDMETRIAAISDRVTYLERRHDSFEEKLTKMDERIDEKMTRLAERIAATPTRDEIVLMFSRLESKIERRAP